MKFKLPTCSLKSHDASVPLDFLFFIFFLFFYFFFILCFYVFCVFGGERHKSGIKLHI